MEIDRRDFIKSSCTVGAGLLAFNHAGLLAQNKPANAAASTAANSSIPPAGKNTTRDSPGARA